MKLSLVIILLGTYQLCNSQEKMIIDIDSFLLGMSDDYFPIYRDDQKSANFVTEFDCSEKKLQETFVDSLLKYFPSEKSILLIENGSIYSKNLSKHFNSFYQIKKDKNLGCVFEGKGEKFYPVYFRYLKLKKFKSNEMKISFLIGNFYRYGNFENGRVNIRMENSFNHRIAIVQFAKSLGFKCVETDICTYCIGGNIKISFIPSCKYSKYFEELNGVMPKRDENDCPQRNDFKLTPSYLNVW